MKKKMSRRYFLKLAGVTSAGLALSNCGVKATEFPEPTSTPMPTATITHTPKPTATITHTPEPTATSEPMSIFGEYQIPEKLVLSSITSLVYALNLANIQLSVEQIKSGIKVQIVKTKGVDSVFCAITSNTGNTISDGAPLLIASQGQNSELIKQNLEWKKVTFANSGKAVGFYVGSTIYPIEATWWGDGLFTEGPYARALNELGVVWAEDMYRPDFIKQFDDSGPNNLKKAVESGDKMILMPANLIYHQQIPSVIADIPKNDQNLIRDVETSMRRTIQFALSRLGGIKPSYVILNNEALYSYIDYLGKLVRGWDSANGQNRQKMNPYYEAYGDKLLLQTLRIAYEEAKKLNLVPGKDVYFLNGMYLGYQPGPQLDWYVEQTDKAKEELAAELNIRPENVAYGIASQVHVSAKFHNTSGLSPDGTGEIPTQNELVQAINIAKGKYGGKVWLTEVGVRDVDVSQATDILTYIMQAAKVGGAEGVVLWNGLKDYKQSQPDSKWDVPSNAIFTFESLGFKPTLLYYNLVRTMLGL